MDEKHSASTLNLSPYFPSSQPALHQTTRCKFLLVHWKYSLSQYTTMCICVPFTSQLSTRTRREYRVFQHLPEGLWDLSWSWIRNYTPKWNSVTSRDLLEVSVQLSKRPCCCTWEQQLFPFDSKKAGWACGTEKLQVQIVFSHCNFLYRTFNSSAANSFTRWEDSKSWGYHNS